MYPNRRDIHGHARCRVPGICNHCLVRSRCLVSLCPSRYRSCFAPAVNFPVDVPTRLFKILQRIVFQVCPPQVFDGVPNAEPHVLSDLDALNAARVAGVVRRVVHHVRVIGANNALMSFGHFIPSLGRCYAAPPFSWSLCCLTFKKQIGRSAQLRQ